MKRIRGPWMVVLLAGICAGCGRAPRVQETGRAPDTAYTLIPPKSQAPTVPAGCTLPTKPADLKVCIGDLQFDDLELAGDDQPLSECHNGQCSQGPRATIQPEKSSHLYKEADLSKGRIIARLFLDQGEKGGYEKLGISAGNTTYWWVQKQVGKTTGKSFYLTVSGDSLVKKEFTMHFEKYPNAPFKQALARWLWDPNDEKTQGTCSSGTCR